MINSIIETMTSNVTKEQEKIIRKIVEQGYKYLVMKKDIEIIGDVAKCNYRYIGFNSREGLEILEKDGYEIFDLNRVIEYLKIK